MAGCVIHIEGVGEVLFESSQRAKRINISIRPSRGVRVAVPAGTPMAQAKAFAVSKKGWIKKHLAEISALETTCERLRHRFEDIDRQAARKVLSQRVDMLAERHGYRYRRLFVRNQKTRWGSCSARNNISLNVKLVRLPDRLMDYVILHELVHTRIKNHGSQFFAEMDRRIANRSQLEAELKQYEQGLG
jgi:predicted metal-dependent hydrolase